MQYERDFETTFEVLNNATINGYDVDMLFPGYADAFEPTQSVSIGLKSYEANTINITTGNIIMNNNTYNLSISSIIDDHTKTVNLVYQIELGQTLFTAT
jgi:hypothetical protein